MVKPYTKLKKLSLMVNSKYKVDLIRRINKRRIKICDKSFYVDDYLYYRIAKAVAQNPEKSWWDQVNNMSWEPHTYRIFNQFLDAEHTYLDIGAYIGMTVLYGCQISKHCYAFEPDPEALRHLKKNISLNPSLKNKITLYEGCISDRKGTVKLNNLSYFGNSSSSIIFNDDNLSTTVPSTTLKDYIKKYHIKDINFIKMDIEGGETIVLPKIKEYLTQEKPTLYLSLHMLWFNNKKADISEIVEAIKHYKYLYDKKGNQIPLNKLSAEILPRESTYEIVASEQEWIKT